jgi:hypothetical protein
MKAKFSYAFFLMVISITGWAQQTVNYPERSLTQLPAL